jgi:hypothetical protein
MALIKSYTMENGITCDNAYYLVSAVVQNKRIADEPDPGGVRPDNSPDHAWRAGVYGRIAVAVYASEEARNAGRAPIASYAQYPTDVIAGSHNTEVNVCDGEDDMRFTIDTESDMSVTAQAYQHLLTLPSFSDATEA